MDHKQLRFEIKRHILEHWAPHRDELGLKGLIEVATDGAFLAALSIQAEPITEQANTQAEPIIPEAEEQEPVETASTYLCPTCGINHKTDSKIGIEHTGGSTK